MKALFILGNYNRGGAERQAVYLAKWLKSVHGFEVEFFAFSDKGPVSEELEKEGIRCSTVPFNFFFIDSFRKFGFNKQSFSYYKKLRAEIADYASAIRSVRADIVMPYTYYPNVVAGLSWKSGGAKLCVWNQRDIGSEGMTGNYAERLAIKRTPTFVSNSRQGADLLQVNAGVDARRIHVIPNGILIPDLRHSGFSEFGLDDRYQHVVMLANFHPFKDHNTLIRAWKIVTTELPELKVRLVLAGRFGATEQTLMALSEQLGIRDSVVFLNSVENVYGLLSLCVLSAFSSVKEGNPNAVLEAMASGLAVAATRIPGCVDALGDSYQYLSPPGDEKAMASNIISLLNSKELRDSVGQSNLGRIKSDFSLERMGQKYIRIFSDHGIVAERLS